MRTALTSLLALTLMGAASAASAAAPQVTVTAGQALQLKSETYGPGTLDGLTHDLARTVGAALERRSAWAAASEVRLVLEDASPSHALQGAQRGSGGGAGLGGAWIDGFVIGVDGKKTPLGFSFYPSGATTRFQPGLWGDAHRAFAMLASDLARGHVPQQNAPGANPPSGEAHYPA